MCRSRRELSNEYLLGEIGVDTAENEPLEVWGKIQFTIHFTPWSPLEKFGGGGRGELRGEHGDDVIKACQVVLTTGSPANLCSRVAGMFSPLRTRLKNIE